VVLFLTKDALHDNYGKRPLLVYLDTRIGLPRQRLYIEQLADAYGEQLWTLRTHEKFEDRVAKREKYAGRDDAGAPGAPQHANVQNELKGRQRETLNSRFKNLVCVTGIRAGESENRAQYPKGEQSRGIQYVKPVYELSKEECARIILEHEDCPINPEWTSNHFTDCACLANGDPSELDTVQDKFPAFGQRIQEYEEAIPDDGLQSVLGWDGLASAEKNAREQGLTQLSLCRGGCQRQVKTPIQRAFESVAEGTATRSEAAAMLSAA